MRGDHGHLPVQTAGPQVDAAERGQEALKPAPLIGLRQPPKVRHLQMSGLP